MARGIVFLLAVVLTAAAGFAVLRQAEDTAPVRLAEDAPAEEPAPREPVQSAARQAPVAEPQAPEIVPRASRDVTPPGVTPGPPVSGPLVRIPPPPKPQAEAPPPRPKIERLFRPVVDSAGSLTTAAGQIGLAEIDAPAPDATCGEGNAAWPCGRMARAELMRFIRGRAIECQVPPGEEHLPDIARCSVGGADIGEWLVRQGWARPAGDAYPEAAREAEEARRGLWGDGSR